MRVRATRTGNYKEFLRHPGAVFDLHSPAHFSANWMEEVADATPIHPHQGEDGSVNGSSRRNIFSGSQRATGQPAGGPTIHPANFNVG